MNVLQNRRQSLPGITYIELLVYSSIVMIIVGVFVMFSGYLIRSTERDRESQSVVTNQRFVEDKMESLLYGITSANIWPGSGSDTVLYYRESGGSFKAIHLSNGKIYLSSASDTNNDGTPETVGSGSPLTNSHVTASGVTVDRLTTNGQQVVRFQASLQGKYISTTIDKRIYLR